MGLFGIKKLIALGAGIMAMAMGASLRMNVTNPSPSPSTITQETNISVSDGDGLPRWQRIWTISAPGFHAGNLSPDGKNVAWVDQSGIVRRADPATGKPLWQSPRYHGVNAVHITNLGVTLVYARLNPGEASVRILDAVAGPSRSALIPVEGAIWCVEPTYDGRLAAVGVGSAALYLIPIRTDAAWPGVSTKLNGIPESLSIAKSASLILTGTWLDSGISVWGLDRIPRWRRHERQSGRTQNVTLCADGSTAIVVSGIGDQKREARLSVWDARTGALRWAENLEGDSPRSAVSADGKFIAISYHRRINERELAVSPKVALFDSKGKRLFGDKGGHFFEPELVCLSGDGQRLTVYDKEGNLWTLNREGRIVSRLRPQANSTGKPIHIDDFFATADGQGLLLYRSDKTLTLYRATL
jgi:hypothetical protein